MPVTTEEAAYAAGFFDGEGCISIAFTPRTFTRKKNGKVYERSRYSLMVSLSQNDPAPVNWLVERFGGSARFVRGKRTYDRGHYERWNWVISTNAAVRFLRTVRPFLLVKASQADLAFEFADTIRITGRAKLPPEIVAKRADLYLKIKQAKDAFRLTKAA